MADCFRQGGCLFVNLIGILLVFYAVRVSSLDHDVARGFLLVKQSSTVESNLAELAVDTDDTTCAQTLENGTWKLDLGENKMVSSLQVKGDGRYNVYISGDKDSLDMKSDQKGAICRFGADGNKALCYNVINGRYVTIVSDPEGKPLKLCHVQLFECDDGYFGRNCSLSCHCYDDEQCPKDSGLCERGCAHGYTGVKCQQGCVDGTFGPDCGLDCHCHLDVTCDKGSGICPSGCKSEWLGNNCQTETPQLSSAPEIQDTESDFITIKWPSWQKYMDQEYKLTYQVDYRPYGTWDWTPATDDESEVLNNPTQYYTDYKVENLQLNTQYAFKVQPILTGPKDDQIHIKPSPELNWIKTKCKAPEPPTSVFATTSPASIYQDSSSANMILHWTPPEEVHCDNILYYTILYRPEDDHQGKVWKRSGAQNNERNTTLENLEFDTDYEVSIVVVNNGKLPSPLEKTNFRTGSAPPTPVTAAKASPAIYIIAGVVIGCVVIITIILTVVIIRHRRGKYAAIPIKEDEEAAKLNGLVKEVDASRTATDDSGLGGEGSSGSTPTAEIQEPTSDKVLTITPPDIPPRPDLLPEEPLPSEPIVREPISVDDLEEYVMRGRETDCQDLIKEYREIPEGFTGIHDCGKREENKHKNRFINIIAYDHSRVILDKVEGDPDSDYVNANYVDGYHEPKRYIASQGCTKYTIQDMWRMVWQVRSHRIVMVTNLIENGKRKCEQYWLDHENVEKLYGDIAVTLLDQEHTTDFTIRTFNIRKGEETRNIKQFHFTAWPDHGVPTRPSPIIHFRRKIRSFDESHAGVLLVHCSAGVGRTGTLIALDYLLDKAKVENIIDLYNLTLRMRKDRVNMIQTAEQYIFVYDALLEALKSGNTAIPCSTFREVYENLCQVNPETDTSPLQQQYETLQSMSAKVKPDDTGSGNLTENEGKNRCPDIVPADRYRPYLMTRVQGTNDYINAIFVDGYKSKNSYIITQMPLPHTVIDMWRMIHEHKCGTIVMLNPHDEEDETYGQYWPGENQECECGPYVIEACSMDSSTPNIVTRELKLQYKPESPKPGASSDLEVRKVNHFQFTCWPRDAKKPNLAHSLIPLIELMEKSQQKTGNGPIVIHCHDGVLQSALYTAVCCIWEKMKVEQEVDIFHTVKYLRYHRPQTIQDLEQYEFCYEMVLAYLAEFEIYANFR